MSYAEGTSVTVEKSKGELERVIRAHGGVNFGTMSLDDEGVALVYFTLGKLPNQRQVRLKLPLPKLGDVRKQYVPRTKKTPEQRWEQACRERWRLLVMVVKAKLELIALGGASVDQEFLASIALPDGKTVLELIASAVGEAYATGKMPMLGPAPAPAVEVEVLAP